MKTEAFGKQAVMTLTGLTYRQIDYWARTGVVKPSIKAGEGRGSRREYSFKDLVALRVAKSLRDEGISLQKIKKSLAYMKRKYSNIKQPLAQWRFLTDGKNIFIVDRDREKILDTLNKGQLIIHMALGEIIEELQGEIKKLAIPKSKRVVVEGQTFTRGIDPGPGGRRLFGPMRGDPGGYYRRRYGARGPEQYRGYFRGTGRSPGSVASLNRELLEKRHDAVC